METARKRELLNEFLERWSLDKVKAMILEEYVSVNNKDTFVYWVEDRMMNLGSIKGMSAIKFGIYRREKKKKESKKPKLYPGDDEYTWMKRFGDTREKAFKNVRKELLQIIEFAERGDFAKIDGLHLSDLFKWKVASLYSNERLVPIFKRDVLNKAATAFGLNGSRSKRVSEIQELLISKRPAELDVYTYMESLFDKYGRDEVSKEDEPEEEISITLKGTDPQLRTVVRTYQANQIHNKLQNALYDKLVAKYGKNRVLYEKKYVDVMLDLPEQIIFYEVKPYSSVMECIREALGQVLAYVFSNMKDDGRERKIVVVGPSPPNESEQKFVDYVKSLLDIEFDYEAVAL